MVCVILFALSISFIASAQSNLDKKITKGLNALYNFKFDKSQKIFQQIIDADSTKPAGYHFQSVAYLWYYLDNKNDTHLENFLSYSDSAINNSEKIIAFESEDPFPFYILGAAYSYRALAFARAEEYLNALWATKESYSYLNKAVALDSLYADAYFGLGLFNFAVSQTPSVWKWALDLTGISGDRNKGMDYLTLAADKGKYSAVDAQFYLSQLNAEFLRDYAGAHYYLDKLVKTYPGNLLFKSTAASLLIKEQKLKKAEKLLSGITTSKDSSFKQIKTYANLFLGDIFFATNDFDSAKTFYQIFLDSTTDNHFKGMVALELGLCYQFTNFPETAAEYYLLTADGNMDLDEDIYAMDMGERYLENPPDSSELSLILIKNLLDAGSYKEALDSLDSLSDSSVSDTIQALINFYRSDAKYHLGDFQESQEMAVSLIENEFAEEWVRAFACYYAARASKELGSILDTQLFLGYANDFNDFHFENKLRNLIYSLSYQFQR
jgi:predicted negative regulator of RcsB-dependent stress response